MKMTLTHEGNNMRQGYSKVPRPVRLESKAPQVDAWFLNLMEELGHLPSAQCEDPHWPLVFQKCPLSLLKMLEISDIERMNIGAHRLGA
jgi:hypothetical protein